MENKKRALGRGLEQLFNSENLDIESFEQAIYEESTNEEILEIPLDELRANPYQPRKVFEQTELEELAASISEVGVFQPIIVKKSIKGYEIIAGERRFRASKVAGKTTIPAIVRDLSEEQMVEIAILENLQRVNLNPIEEALAYKNMIDKLGLTQDEVSKRVSKSRSYITNAIGILKLPDVVQGMILEGDITMSHARTLSKLEDDSEIVDLAHQIVTDKLPVREVEEITKDEVKKNIIKKKEVNSDFKYVEDLLIEKLDTRVKVKDKVLEISFTNIADLNRILEIFNIKGD